MLARHLIRIILVTVTLLSLLCNCQEREIGLPSILRVGILPDQSNQKITERYEPLLNHLRAELNISIELIKAKDYKDLSNLFINQQVDLAYFGALTYLQTKQEVPINAIVMRDIDAHFTSYFIVHKDQPYQSLDETTGTSLLFGSKLSTSGHLMPRYFLSKQNIIPEHFYSHVDYSGKHDETIIRVANKESEVGALNASLYDRLRKEENQFALKTRVIWETPPYTDYMWTLQRYYSIGAANQIRDAFLSLSYNNPAHRRILDNLGSKGYIPVVDQNLTDINEFAKSLGLIK